MENKENILEILKKHIMVWPVDVYALSENLGIKVNQKSLDDKYSGFLKKINGKYEITVNSNHSENRKRFTIAHEIGHFILHDELIGEGIFDNTAYRSDHDEHRNENIKQFHETQANKLAAAILMPEFLLKQRREQGVNDITSLADDFGVSEQAMKIRLKSVA